MKKLLFVFGTRPEAIKLAPIIIEAKKQPQHFDVKVCITAQHREMLDQVLDFFEIVPDVDLNLMTNGQSLSALTTRIISNIEPVLQKYKPDSLVVQGDTTTVLAASLAAFYQQIPIAHVEAGLRSNNLSSPFPEEANRLLVSKLAHWHFCPTEQAQLNLKVENITKNVSVVGNSVVDALQLGISMLSDHEKKHDYLLGDDSRNKILLVTGHRRESFGQGFLAICQALLRLAQKYPALKIIYPVHLNPRVQEPVKRILGDEKNCHLIEPVTYPEMLFLLQNCDIVLTDSGGIQEEAPSLGKPVLVMRDVTERIEGIQAGTAKLVGTNIEAIVANVEELLDDEDKYRQMAKAHNPYGDGKTAIKILKELVS
jgi:UDP-N-acetylglucosamine 2-epimerase (non-hydrolysing)